MGVDPDDVPDGWNPFPLHRSNSTKSERRRGELLTIQTGDPRRQTSPSSSTSLVPSRRKSSYENGSEPEYPDLVRIP